MRRKKARQDKTKQEHKRKSVMKSHNPRNSLVAASRHTTLQGTPGGRVGSFQNFKQTETMRLTEISSLDPFLGFCFLGSLGFLTSFILLDMLRRLFDPVLRVPIEDCFV